MIRQELLDELRQFFKGKQVEFTARLSGMVSLHDMVYDGKEWFCITGRAVVNISDPKIAKLKHELTVSLNEAFDKHVRGND